MVILVKLSLFLGTFLVIVSCASQKKEYGAFREGDTPESCQTVPDYGYAGTDPSDLNSQREVGFRYVTPCPNPSK